MPLMIREMSREDCSAVAALWRDELQCASVTDESLTDVFDRMRADPAYQTFVADEGGELVGFATAVWVLAAEYPSGYVKMNGIAVRQSYQNQGVGTALMARVEAFARERGAAQIGLASGLRRTGAHAFYERLGYKKGSYYFSKRL